MASKSREPSRRTTRSQQSLIPGGFRAPESPEEETFAAASQRAPSSSRPSPPPPIPSPEPARQGTESAPPDIPYPPNYEYRWNDDQQLIKVDWRLVKYGEVSVDLSLPINRPLEHLSRLIPEQA